MAPEMIEDNREYDKRVDIFSFSICLFEMLFLFPVEGIPKDGKLSFSNIALVMLSLSIPLLEITYVVNLRGGWRPRFPEIPSLEHSGYVRLIKMCWQHKSEYRPTATRALSLLCNILPGQILAKQKIKDGKDWVRLLVRGEEFFARRSTLARVRRSHLWELFGGGRESDPAKNEDGFIELDEDPTTFETVLRVLQSLAEDSKELDLTSALRRLAIPPHFVERK